MIAMRGVTLIELIVTLAVLAIVLGMGAPALSHTLRENRLAAATNDLSRIVALARSSAIKHGGAVTLCKTSDQWSCDSTTPKQWTGGWLLFVDPARNQNCQDANRDGLCDGHGGRILHQGALQLPANITIHNNAAVNAHFITFNELGTAPGFMRTFTICDTGAPEAARQLRLAKSGRLRVIHRAELSECPS